MAQTRQYNDSEAALVLSFLPHIGPRSFANIFEKTNGKIGRLLSLSKDDLMFTVGLSPDTADRITHWRDFIDLDRQLSAIEAFGSKFIPIFADDYPATLKSIGDAPIGIHCAGKPLPACSCVAIVGTRRCSFAGEKLAHELGKAMAENGIATVSGLAMGIDAAAHAGTLAGGGHTVAVLGGGLDVVYPPDSAGLYDTVRRDGTLVSEFSVGRHVDKRSFVIRNRIITGLSDAVIVVESPPVGGSMFSARMASEQGRPLFAVGGEPSLTNGGCLELISSGVATEIGSAEEFLEYFKNSPSPRIPNRQSLLDFEVHVKKEKPQLDDVEEKIWTLLEGSGPSSVDDVAAALSMDVLECAMSMQSLCVRGILKKEFSGEFRIA
ncbi:MAG: DNA-protecting protein DprA [Puniceicoccales bacterium]|jgi:DNA processing protein|nr:DNA-protecting protein DprA [Puniceicoccales bacterium]